jgi:hypothetical protein
MVDRRGIEPLTRCLPSSTAHQWRAAHTSGTGESNPAIPGSKPGPVTVPVAPERPAVGDVVRRRWPGLRMPSTLEFSTITCAASVLGPVRMGGRTRTHYLRFWRPPCNLLHLAHMKFLPCNEKPPGSLAGRAASGSLWAYPRHRPAPRSACLALRLDSMPTMGRAASNTGRCRVCVAYQVFTVVSSSWWLFVFMNNDKRAGYRKQRLFCRRPPPWRSVVRGVAAAQRRRAPLSQTC